MIIIAKYILRHTEMVEIKTTRGRKEMRARKLYEQLKYECYKYTILNMKHLRRACENDAVNIWLSV